MLAASVFGTIGQLCAPKRIVPPRSEFSSRTSTLPVASFHSVIKPINLCSASALNSVLLALFKLATFLANSITANCMPKQMPKYGILFSRAYFIALIFPSVPRTPKPPGIKIASIFFNASVPVFSISSLSI